MEWQPMIYGVRGIYLLLIYHLILYSSMERPVATPRPEEGLRAPHRLCAPTRQRQHAHASCVLAARSAGQGCWQLAVGSWLLAAREQLVQYVYDDYWTY